MRFFRCFDVQNKKKSLEIKHYMQEHRKNVLKRIQINKYDVLIIYHIPRHIFIYVQINK